jgi:hypothetical protein
MNHIYQQRAIDRTLCGLIIPVEEQETDGRKPWCRECQSHVQIRVGPNGEREAVILS